VRRKMEERNEEKKGNTWKESREFSWSTDKLKCTFWVQKWNKAVKHVSIEKPEYLRTYINTHEK
jgi:hypothetical protein